MFVLWLIISVRLLPMENTSSNYKGENEGGVGGGGDTHLYYIIQKRRCFREVSGITPTWLWELYRHSTRQMFLKDCEQEAACHDPTWNITKRCKRDDSAASSWIICKFSNVLPPGTGKKPPPFHPPPPPRSLSLRRGNAKRVLLLDVNL